MSTDWSTTDDQALRDRAVKRLKKQRDFRIHLLMYVLINGLLVVIWAMTGAGFFWPIFPIAGWGIGVAANAWDAYGRDVPTEAEIRREMDRLRTRTCTRRIVTGGDETALSMLWGFGVILTAWDLFYRHDVTGRGHPAGDAQRQVTRDPVFSGSTGSRRVGRCLGGFDVGARSAGSP